MMDNLVHLVVMVATDLLDNLDLLVHLVAVVHLVLLVVMAHLDLQGKEDMYHMLGKG